jgi:hypothetical protein
VNGTGPVGARSWAPAGRPAGSPVRSESASDAGPDTYAARNRISSSVPTAK